MGKRPIVKHRLASTVEEESDGAPHSVRVSLEQQSSTAIACAIRCFRGVALPETNLPMGLSLDTERGASTHRNPAL